MAEVSKEELRRRIHVVLQTWTDEQDAGKPTFAPYDQWAACIEVLQSVEPLLARMAGPGEVVVPKEPTPEMLNAAIDVDSYKLGDISPLGFRCSPQQLFQRCYAAMLAARPNNGGNGV